MRTAVVKQLQAGEIVKLTQQSQAMKETANSVIPIVTKVKDLADQIQKLDLMGTLGGRWRSLISRESSASSIEGLTPAQKQLVGQFITESGLLVSGVAKAHGGARGGGSIQMVEQLKPLLDPGNKDLDTYLGNLNGAMDVLNGYAHMGESGGGTQPPPSAAEIPANVQAALKGQPAGKHTLSDGSVWQIDAKGAISPVPKGGG
jgi:hypothetical protein